MPNDRQRDHEEAIRRGVERHQAGDLAEAERAYRSVLQADPHNGAALHLLGLLAGQVGDRDLSIALISQACGLDPRNAEYYKSLGDAYLVCARAPDSLACYQAALNIKPDYADALNNRGVALQELGRLEDALASFSAALSARRDYADAHSNRASALLGLRRPGDALAACDQALLLQSGHRDALANRATALLNLSRYEEALLAFDQALAGQPGKPGLWNYRGRALRELGRRDEALASVDQALRLHPLHPDALTNRGMILHDLGRFEEELADYEAVLAAKPDHALAHTNEALCRLLLGDFERGWQKYEWRWRSDALPLAEREFMQPLWLGDRSVAGKRILLHAEQGIGDTLQFLRYAPEVARQGAHVILEVPRVLKPLLSEVSGVDQVLAVGDPLPEFDLHCPLMSLPLACRDRLGNAIPQAPYPSAGQRAAVEWRTELAAGGELLVGLCWRGSPTYLADRDRSLPLAVLRPLFDCRGVRFVSLQRELHAEEQALTAELACFSHPGEGFAETASLVAALDLVISVDTAWAHWAGAIGRPVWVLLALVPHWCWHLGREDSPWYPSARLFRQARRNEWADVVSRLAPALERFCSAAAEAR